MPNKLKFMKNFRRSYWMRFHLEKMQQKDLLQSENFKNKEF